MFGNINMTKIPHLHLKMPFIMFLFVKRTTLFKEKEKMFDKHFLLNSFILPQNKNLALVL